MQRLSIVLACLLSALCARAEILIDDFEDVSDWSGLDADSSLAVEGASSGRWDDHPDQTGVSKTFATPLNAGAEDTLIVWIHSGVANGAQIELIFDSENAGSDGWDYYRHQINVDWTGWRHFWIPLADFVVSRQPVGWHELNSVQLSASGWSHEALEDTILHLDDMRFTSALVDDVQVEYGYSAGDYLYTYRVALSEKAGGQLSAELTVDLPPDSDWQASVEPLQLDLGPGQVAEALVSLLLPAANILPDRWLATDTASFAVRVDGRERDNLLLPATVPLPERATPRLLLDAGDFTRIQAWAASYPWAEAVVAGILSRADNWPGAHNDKYGLASWELPPEGGQWTLWYVCPEHGVSLGYDGPGRNICPIDGHNFTGWPYDQVIFAWRHGDSARAAQDLGLAYRLSGDPSYAGEAATILLAYADVYMSYPLHDVNGGQGNSGARASAQTLDESSWLIPLAWGYDLVADSPALTDADRLHIEQDLLRAALDVIRRNDAGMSNWQSWHNAAVAAVGFGLQDARLTSAAVYGPSGFIFQMQNSVTADGFWYEGSWGYHFFALDPLMHTALMAESAGIDLFGQEALHEMFGCAVRFSMPDLTLPPFNDSQRQDLSGKRGMYEVAYARYLEEELAVPMGNSARGREALFWGLEEVPQQAARALGSLVFPDAGYVVLRAGRDDRAHYLALDYGPHGGWHGHYDKLGFVSFARGEVMGQDPGTQSYAAPTHTSWDKVTVAHNTVVIDESSQAEATGSLIRSVLLADVGFARAEAGPVYPDTARLTRTMALTPDYALDVFQVDATDGASHRIDLVYHNPGGATADLALAAYNAFPDLEGYQHLLNCRAAAADDGFAVTFDMEGAEEPEYGSVWTSDPGIDAKFTKTRDQAASGNGSGRLHYDFTAAEGYILYSTEAPPPVAEVPADLRMDVYGDGSGHQLRFRIMDATGERFVATIGPIDWNGWSTVSAQDITGWSHYLGNDDGVVDTPVSAVVIALHSEAGGPVAGDLFVDNIVLIYPGAGETLVADFDRPYRALTWQMAPGVGTTLVVGEGLGPDLRIAVPFAMARRQSSATKFVSLLEPHGSGRQVNVFEVLGVDAPDADQATAFRVQAAGWDDFMILVGEGQAGPARKAADWSCDGLLCYARRDPAGLPLALAVAEASLFADAQRSLLESTARLPELRADRENDSLRIAGDPQGATVRILSPGTTEVTLNGGPVNWEADGDYVVLNPGLSPDGATDAGPDAGADAGTDSGPDAGSDAGTDAGTDGATDAGSDAGSGAGIEGGCGCGRSGAGSFPWMVLLIPALALRKEKRVGIDDRRPFE
ncbi:MAG TPA: heparinase II/III family protein [Myxococcota bacterium]|nr:heparinase II/III family protein [Myxococcota bacterium]